MPASRAGHCLATHRMAEAEIIAAEIIAVGSELLTADKIDTNSLWLTAELNGIGIEVVRKIIVGDERTGSPIRFVRLPGARRS